MNSWTALWWSEERQRYVVERVDLDAREAAQYCLPSLDAAIADFAAAAHVEAA